MLACSFAACDSASDGDEPEDSGGEGGTAQSGAGGLSKGGSSGKGSAGLGGTAGGLSGGAAGKAGASGTAGVAAGSGGAGATAAGGRGGSGGDLEAGAGGESEGGTGNTAGVPSTCAAVAAVDHVNDAVPCASTTTCEPDALGRSWSPPIRIDDGTGCVSGPLHVALPNVDRGFVAWSDADPSRVRVRRTAANAAWDAIEPLGDGWGADLDAASGGGAFLLLGTSVGRLDARATELEASFGAASTLTSALARNDPRTELAIDSTSQGLALWAEGAISFRYSTWTSASGWAAAIAMPVDFIRGSIAPIPGGGFVLAAINTGGIFLRIYRPGTGWGLGENVNGFNEATAANEAMVSVAADALGAVHVAYTFPIENDPYAEILYDERNPDGTWETTRGFFTETGVDARSKPLLAVSDDGDVILAWQRSNSTLPKMAVTVRENRSWAEPRNLDSSYVTVSPSVAMDATGNAIIAWGRDDTSFGLVRANRYIAGTGWDNLTYLVLHDDPTATAATHLSAAMSPTGEALIAYVVKKPGETDRVFAQTLR